MMSRFTLYQIFNSAFCVLVILSNVISAKMIELPYIHLCLPAGLITYPMTFLISDLVTEIYGAKKARVMVYTAFGMNILGFGIITLALWLPASHEFESAAFHETLGLSGWRIFSSLAAYLTAQVLDIQLYALIKRWTGPRWLWLRSNGSTCASQLVDTVMIDMIYLYGGLGMELTQVLPIMLISYMYKAIFSVVNTPLFYLCLYLIKIKGKMHKWIKPSIGQYTNAPVNNLIEI